MHPRPVGAATKLHAAFPVPGGTDDVICLCLCLCLCLSLMIQEKHRKHNQRGGEREGERGRVRRTRNGNKWTVIAGRDLPGRSVQGIRRKFDSPLQSPRKNPPSRSWSTCLRCVCAHLSLSLSVSLSLCVSLSVSLCVSLSLSLSLSLDDRLNSRNFDAAG